MQKGAKFGKALSTGRLDALPDPLGAQPESRGSSLCASQGSDQGARRQCFRRGRDLWFWSPCVVRRSQSVVPVSAWQSLPSDLTILKDEEHLEYYYNGYPITLSE